MTHIYFCIVGWFWWFGGGCVPVKLLRINFEVVYVTSWIMVSWFYGFMVSCFHGFGAWFHGLRNKEFVDVWVTIFIVMQKMIGSFHIWDSLPKGLFASPVLQHLHNWIQLEVVTKISSTIMMKMINNEKWYNSM